MQIPKSFQISEHTYNVILKRHLRVGIAGQLDAAKKEIKIGKRSKRRNIAYKHEDMVDTFWHEVVHLILYDMSEPRWRDEALVTAFANRLTQVVLSAKLE